MSGAVQPWKMTSTRTNGTQPSAATPMKRDTAFSRWGESDRRYSRSSLCGVTVCSEAHAGAAEYQSPLRIRYSPRAPGAARA